MRASVTEGVCALVQVTINSCHEDRTEVREELAGLKQLHVADPEIHMMAGDDAAAIDSFEKNGLLVKGF